MTSTVEFEKTIESVDMSVLESNADVYIQEVDCSGVCSTNLALAINEKYPDVFDLYKYKASAIRRGRGRLGDAQIISCEDGKYICNLFVQSATIHGDGISTNYEALFNALETVSKYFSDKTIAIPYYMGCEDGRGKWALVYAIIEKIFQDTDNHIIICMDEES